MELYNKNKLNKEHNNMKFNSIKEYDDYLKKQEEATKPKQPAPRAKKNTKKEEK